MARDSRKRKASERSPAKSPVSPGSKRRKGPAHVDPDSDDEAAFIINAPKKPGEAHSGPSNLPTGTSPFTKAKKPNKPLYNRPKDVPFSSSATFAQSARMRASQASASAPLPQRRKIGKNLAQKQVVSVAVPSASQNAGPSGQSAADAIELFDSDEDPPSASLRPQQLSSSAGANATATPRSPTPEHTRRDSSWSPPSRIMSPTRPKVTEPPASAPLRQQTGPVYEINSSDNEGRRRRRPLRAPALSSPISIKGSSSVSPAISRLPSRAGNTVDSAICIDLSEEDEMNSLPAPPSPEAGSVWRLSMPPDLEEDITLPPDADGDIGMANRDSNAAPASPPPVRHSSSSGPHERVAEKVEMDASPDVLGTQQDSPLRAPTSLPANVPTPSPAAPDPFDTTTDILPAESTSATSEGAPTQIPASHLFDSSADDLYETTPPPERQPVPHPALQRAATPTISAQDVLPRTGEQDAPSSILPISTPQIERRLSSALPIPSSQLQEDREASLPAAPTPTSPPRISTTPQPAITPVVLSPIRDRARFGLSTEPLQRAGSPTVSSWATLPAPSESAASTDVEDEDLEMEMADELKEDPDGPTSMDRAASVPSQPGPVARAAVPSQVPAANMPPPCSAPPKLVSLARSLPMDSTQLPSRISSLAPDTPSASLSKVKQALQTPSGQSPKKRSPMRSPSKLTIHKRHDRPTDASELFGDSPPITKKPPSQNAKAGRSRPTSLSGRILPFTLGERRSPSQSTFPATQPTMLDSSMRPTKPPSLSQPASVGSSQSKGTEPASSQSLPATVGMPATPSVERVAKEVEAMLIHTPAPSEPEQLAMPVPDPPASRGVKRKRSEPPQDASSVTKRAGTPSLTTESSASAAASALADMLTASAAANAAATSTSETASVEAPASQGVLEQGRAELAKKSIVDVLNGSRLSISEGLSYAQALNLSPDVAARLAQNKQNAEWLATVSSSNLAKAASLALDLRNTSVEGDSPKPAGHTTSKGSLKDLFAIKRANAASSASLESSAPVSPVTDRAAAASSQSISAKALPTMQQPDVPVPKRRTASLQDVFAAKRASGSASSSRDPSTPTSLEFAPIPPSSAEQSSYPAEKSQEPPSASPMPRRATMKDLFALKRASVSSSASSNMSSTPTSAPPTPPSPTAPSSATVVPTSTNLAQSASHRSEDQEATIVEVSLDAALAPSASLEDDSSLPADIIKADTSERLSSLITQAEPVTRASVEAVVELTAQTATVSISGSAATSEAPSADGPPVIDSPESRHIMDVDLPPMEALLPLAPSLNGTPARQDAEAPLLTTVVQTEPAAAEGDGADPLDMDDVDMEVFDDLVYPSPSPEPEPDLVLPLEGAMEITGGEHESEASNYNFDDHEEPSSPPVRKLRRSTRRQSQPNASRAHSKADSRNSHSSRSQSEISSTLDDESTPPSSPSPLPPPPPTYDGHSGKMINGPFNDLYIDGHWVIENTPARYLHDNPPPVYYAKDLPHLLQDRMNSMSEDYRTDDTARQVFLAAVQHNTLKDEPEAPDLDVVNEIDDEKAPPWEFHYTNNIWVADGVPPPDLENLQGCSCVGRCNPENKDCLCIKKQAKYWDHGGFVYDSNGRLKKEYQQNEPIFECSDLCGCWEDCPNRVVQRGRRYPVNIKKTKKKGWGAFAGAKKIPKHTYIGIYAGELITEQEGERRGRVYDRSGRTYLFDLHFWYLEQAHQDEPYVVDAYHAGNFTRFLNHSCDPNCILTPCYINEANIRKPCLTVWTLRDIDKDEELTFAYYGDVDPEEEEEVKKKNDAVYAPCHCGTANCRKFLFK